MPFRVNADLPQSVRNVLPAHAQTIYRQAFNHAWEEYENARKRKTEESREEVSHKVAWSAVKKKYHKGKSGEKWQLKESS